jgi:glycosyltransferase involved in cell wall biosynthesis
MEADVVRHADALVFVNEQTAERVMRKYPDEWRRKAHVVPHGYDCSDISPSEPAAPDDRLTVAYTGRFYDGIRTPEHLLHALTALGRRRPLARELHVSFVGTPVASHLQLASRLGLDDVVEFTGRLSFAESSRRAGAADVLLVIDAPATESLFLPSKLIDYLPAGKPILALTPPRGASADLIRALGYPIIGPDDESGIAAALEALIVAKQERRLTTSATHSEVAQRYDIRRTAGAFAEILARCA